MTALRALALVAFLFVPGWLAVSLLEEKEDVLDGRERVFLAALLGTGITAISALVLSLASAYSLASLLITVGAISAPLALMARSRLGWIGRLGWRDSLLTLAVISAALIIAAPPGRTVFGWSDVGVYTAIAANIEREGGAVMEVRTVREVAPERREMLYAPAEEASRPFEAYENKAFTITDAASGKVVPSFYWLWPSLMAVFASFLGLDAMFWTVTAMGVLALWGAWLLSRRLLGWRWGLAATSLMAVSPLFVYFSRYTTSEMMNMALFVGGSLCLAAFLEAEEGDAHKEARGVALAAAFLFTLGFFCRIDFLLVIPPLLVFFAARRVFAAMRASGWWFCGLTLGGAAAATLVGMRFSAPYFFSVFTYLARDLRRGIPTTAAGLVAVTAAFVFAPRLKGALRRVARLRKALLAALWLSLAGLFIYLYFVRPGGADGVVAYGVINPTKGSSYVKETLVRWGWYLSFPGLALVFIGYALWFTRQREAPRLPVAMMGLALTIGYSFDMRCTPLHIIAMRRLVPVIFPLAVLMVAYCLKLLAEGAPVFGTKKWVGMAGGAAAGALLLYLLLFAAGASVPIFGLEEGGNQLEICGEVAGSVESDGVVLMDFHLGDHFGPPLRGFFGLENAWLLENASLSGKDFLALLSDLGFPGRDIYLLWRPGMSGYHVPVAEGVGLEEIADLTAWEETLEKSFEKRPSKRRYDSEKILLFRFVEANGAT